MKHKKGFVTNVISHTQHFLKKSYQDNIPALAGQSAFFIILSVVPFLMFVFTIVSLLTGKNPESFVPSNVSISPSSEFFPYYRSFIEFIEGSIRTSGSGTAVITAVVTLWSAGKGLYCITEGISRIYKLPNKSLWLVKRIYAMGYTIVMLLMMMICMAALTVDVLLVDGIGSLFGEYRAKWLTVIVVLMLFGLLQACIMTLALKLYLRRKVRNKRCYSFRALFPGMILTVAAWDALTFGVMIYVRNFAASSIYGSLVSVFMIMIWIYFVMYILLYGIQLDYIYRRWFSRKKKKTFHNRAVTAENIDDIHTLPRCKH